MNTSISGLSLETLLKRTKSALSELTGSPISDDKKVISFLVAQFGVRNEHVLPKLFSKNAGCSISPRSELMLFPTSHNHEQCMRCNCSIDVGGYCIDETCPFSDYLQTDVDKTCGGHLGDHMWPESKKRKCIDAVIIADNQTRRVEFDASPVFMMWLKTGMLEHALDVFRSEGFSGNAITDRIVELVSKENREVRSLLNYCASTQNTDEPVGFCCTLYSSESIKSWIHAFDPELSTAWIKE